MTGQPIVGSVQRMDVDPTKQLRGWDGPDERGNYTCQRCGSEVYGPREFVLSHTQAHLDADLDAMPDCKSCGKKMTPALGEPVRFSVDEETGARQIDFTQRWMCVDKECEMYEIEVTVSGD